MTRPFTEDAGSRGRAAPGKTPAKAELGDETTIGAVFEAAVHRYANRPFLVVPVDGARTYLPEGFEIAYGEAGARVRALAELYRLAGYGLGHRVAVLLENHPEYVLNKIALNSLGACCVPINPDYRPGEMAYLIDHSEPDLILVLGTRREQIAAALGEGRHRAPVVVLDDLSRFIPAPSRPALGGGVTASAWASILYTSGTTGRPKGCILSHGYEVASGARYAELGGVAALRPGEDRIYNPLPLYHVNSAVVSLMAAILTGCCQIQPERFHPQRWWREIVQTEATVAHYLGIIAAMLYTQPVTEDERAHKIRFGLGAGVEPQLHRAMEERFRFPLVEIWGMTEMVRLLSDNVEPRQVGTRAFGRAFPGLEVRVVDEGGCDVAAGQPGEMVFRHSAESPRRGCFSGYLNDPAATEEAWRGGWFHTGDIVWKGDDGLLHFIDRKKNIIRRSGENIAAAEVEALLLTHPSVRQAAVMAVPDELREEEVLAAIVLRTPLPYKEAAEAIFGFCLERLAYYKAPGWIHVVASLPTTGTQKIQKHVIYPAGTDPRLLPDIVDLRAMKRRRRD